MALTLKSTRQGEFLDREHARVYKVAISRSLESGTRRPGPYMDVEIVVYSSGTADGEPKFSLFHAHQCVLQKSPVLKRLFLGTDHRFQSQVQIVLGEFCPEAVESLLQFLYTGSVKFWQKSNIARDFRTLANQLKLNPNVSREFVEPPPNARKRPLKSTTKPHTTSSAFAIATALKKAALKTLREPPKHLRIKPEKRKSERSPKRENPDEKSVSDAENNPVTAKARIGLKHRKRKESASVAKAAVIKKNALKNLRKPTKSKRFRGDKSILNSTRRKSNVLKDVIEDLKLRPPNSSPNPTSCESRTSALVAKVSTSPQPDSPPPEESNEQSVMSDAQTDLSEAQTDLSNAQMDLSNPQEKSDKQAKESDEQTQEVGEQTDASGEQTLKSDEQTKMTAAPNQKIEKEPLEAQSKNPKMRLTREADDRPDPFFLSVRYVDLGKHSILPLGAHRKKSRHTKPCIVMLKRLRFNIANFPQEPIKST